MVSQRRFARTDRVIPMTDTELKLEDAATQLDIAAASSDRNAVVRSCLNGMIEMGRSVTFIMQKESGGSAELTRWYKARMTALMESLDGPLLDFFNSRRVFSVHRGVPKPQKLTATITGSSVPSVEAGMTVILWTFEGVHEYLPKDDSGGAFRLGMRYIAILRALVAEWLTKRKELGIT